MEHMVHALVSAGLLIGRQVPASSELMGKMTGGLGGMPF